MTSAEHDHPRKTHVSGVFDRAAASYDAVGVDFFSPLAAALVDRAGAQPGQRVLDVGCGRGAALVRLAERVGPTGRVVGIDIAPGMVERTAADVAELGLEHVEVRVGDCDHPPVVDGGWDLVSASLVLFFLPEPESTVRRLADVLRPGGVLVASSFEPGDTRYKAVHEAIAPFWVTSDEPPGPPAAGPFATVESVEAMLHAAGFIEVDTVLVEHSNTYRDAEHWLEWTWSTGGRQMWEAVAPGQLDAAYQAARAALTANLTESDGTIREHFRVRLTRAVRA